MIISKSGVYQGREYKGINRVSSIFDNGVECKDGKWGVQWDVREYHITSGSWSEVTDILTGAQFGGEAHWGLGIYSDGSYRGEVSTAWGIASRKGVKKVGVE